MRGHGLLRAAEACTNSSEFGGACDSGYKCGWGACACLAAVDCTCHNVTLAAWDDSLGGLVCPSPDWSALPGAAQPGATRADALEVALNGQNFESSGFIFTRYALGGCPAATIALPLPPARTPTPSLTPLARPP